MCSRINRRFAVSGECKKKKKKYVLVNGSVMLFSPETIYRTIVLLFSSSCASWRVDLWTKSSLPVFKEAF